MERIKKHFEEALKVLETFMNDGEQMLHIQQAGDILAHAFQKGNKVISCGNGGSMCDAMHFAEELAGKFRDERKPLPAVAISDPSYLTCTANDFGFEAVFARYVEAHGRQGDVLLAITTSGNSVNVLKAIDAALGKKMPVIALTGKDGGKAGQVADIEIRAPQAPYADRAQEIHIKVIHTLIDYIEQALFSPHRSHS